MTILPIFFSNSLIQNLIQPFLTNHEKVKDYLLKFPEYQHLKTSFSGTK